MSMLGNIIAKVLGKEHGDAPAGAKESAAPPPATPSAAPATPVVDVAAVLDALKKQANQELNWKTSIVDLMKLLSIDSSLTARKELAKELQYTGDTSDSAAMNVWLHKQIMKKLAENGGKLPEDMKHLV